MLKKNTLLLMLLCVFCSASAANFLTFTAEENGSSFEIVCKGDCNPDLHISMDGGKRWTFLAEGDVITMGKGDKILLKGNNPLGISKDWYNYMRFVMTGSIAASGSVMSLIDGKGENKVIPNDYCFCKLFERCASLTQAPELPATGLTTNCYSHMFYGCTGLTQAPALPALRLANGCYYEMFAKCVNLT